MVNLKRIRMARGMTQAEVAEELGITRQAYGAWERGTVSPSVDDALMLARLLCTSLDGLTDEYADSLAEETSWWISDRSPLSDKDRKRLRSMISFAVEYVVGGGEDGR